MWTNNGGNQKVVFWITDWRLQVEWIRYHKVHNKSLNLNHNFKNIVQMFSNILKHLHRNICDWLHYKLTSTTEYLFYILILHILWRLGKYCNPMLGGIKRSYILNKFCSEKLQAFLSMCHPYIPLGIRRLNYPLYEISGLVYRSKYKIIVNRSTAHG